MSPPFVLAEATKDDCEAIAKIEFEACTEDPGFSTIFPEGATPAILEDYTRRFESDLKDDPTCYMYLARHVVTREVASFATWHFFPERSQEEIDEQILMDDFHLPDDANREAGNRLIHLGIVKRHEIMGTRPYALLAATGTSLKFRKQGAASFLLQHGIGITDGKGLPAYVEGTPIAKGLYAKFGFEEVDRLKLQLIPWKEGDFWNVCMVRPANVKC